MLASPHARACRTAAEYVLHHPSFDHSKNKGVCYFDMKERWASGNLTVAAD